MDLNKLKIMIAEKTGASHKSSSKILDAAIQLIRESM